MNNQPSDRKNLSVTEFLARNPSLTDILGFVEETAQRIVAERKAAGSRCGEVTLEG